MGRSLAKVLVALLAVALLGAACSKKEESGVKGTITIAGEKANDSGTETVSGSTFSLKLDNDGNTFYFEPTVLKGKSGQRVTLKLRNVGDVKHNFTVEDQNINTDLDDPGSSATVTVTWPQSGILEFHCEYHESVGMVGEFVASP